MLISRRDQRPPDDSTTSPGNSLIAYRRTSIPSIGALSIASSSSSSSSVASISLRRAPLAPLHTQASPSVLPDDHMSTSHPASSQFAYPLQDQSIDSDPRQDIARLLARPIVPNRAVNDDVSPGLPLPRKRSIPGHNSSSRTAPYPSGRSNQRRPSNTSIATASSGRRTSYPTIHAYGSPVPPAQTENTPYPLPNPVDDLYSNLSTFTFGAVSLPPPSNSTDPSDMIGPLTKAPGSLNVDCTPRPSFSGPASVKPQQPSYAKSRHGKQKAKEHLDADLGDDEYEDEDDVARQKSRSKMRAIDDGSRRPSLPTNVYIPNSFPSAESSAPYSPAQVRQPNSPGGATGSERDSGVDSDADHGELDTDVEFDLQGQSTVDDNNGVSSDNAAQRRFDGSGHVEYHNSRPRNVVTVNSDGSGDDSDEPGVSVSPVTFSRHDYDSEGPEVDTFYVGPEQPSPGRRGSIPRKIPGAVPRDCDRPVPNDYDSPALRVREDSMATITAEHTSRSMDVDISVSSVDPFNGAFSEPTTKADFRTLEAHVQAQASQHFDQFEQFEHFNFQQPQSPTTDDESRHPMSVDDNVAPTDVYDGFNMDYILSGPLTTSTATSRRSWAPSMVQQGSDGRRPSTFTTASGEDAFTKHLAKNDVGYTQRKLEWSFRMESSDVKGPRGSISVAHGPLTKADMRKPMEPGLQEIWRQAHIGRFRVDRLAIKPDQPDKAPQQRVNIRHIVDPFSLENKRGGPHSVIHKHSRAVAFSVFRAHSLFSNRRRTPSHMSASISILLATRKVQEQYTSTRTTSKLNSHGLLEDRPRGNHPSLSGSTAVASTSSTDDASIKSKSKRSKSKGRKHRDDGHISSNASSQTTSAQSGQGSTSAVAKSPSHSPEPSSPHSPVSGHGHAMSLSSTVTDPFASPVEPPAVASTLKSPPLNININNVNASASTSGLTRTLSSTSTLSARGIAIATTFPHPVNRDVDDDELEDPPRTSHAEAFATVSPTYIDILRGRGDHRSHQEDPSSHSIVGALRRRLLGQSGNRVGGRPPASVPATAAREGNYTPPWLTMAPRSQQEERERVIQTLNESFKDVGLLPSFRPNKPHAAKQKSRKSVPSTNILANVPSDSLYMLLPLWPGETDEASAQQNEDPATYIVPVEERQYLLVYYVPFPDELKKKKGDKKRTRAETHLAPSSSSHSGDHISLDSFRVCARLVCYADLRHTGVRLPDCGLSVTGSMAEAVQYLPPKSIREKALDDVIIGVCHSRRAGMEFLTEGLTVLGLCKPPESEPVLPVREEDPIEEVEVFLTPIGRAAVEMAWLGCMALTCF